MLSSFQRKIGSDVVSIETGRLAQQANGSVLARHGDSVVLVTATMGKPREGVDFFPLTIDFEERLYARGKIPGSFFRREGRPSTEAILTDRLTDRPLRPLFPKGFRNEVQIIITALSADQERPLDILGMIGASAALSISDIPFAGPIGATRVGYLDGEFVINPTYQQSEKSQLDLVVAGSEAGVMMMEAGAHELSEEVVLEGIRKGQEANLEVIALQKEMVSCVGKDKVSYEPAGYPEELGRQVSAAVASQLEDALAPGTGKAEQADRLSAVKSQVIEDFGTDYEATDVADAYEALVAKEFRRRILRKGERPDGRGLKEIRPVSCDVGILPRTHGTGLFQRGETQVLGVATLGPAADAQRLDTLSPVDKKRFLLHYNSPPYSNGETGRVGSPRRREIGHGALAERALLPVLPSEEEFPYTIRLVAEVLSSNGSTSMGSVCACALALMDAGVPIRTLVAGISTGLITGENGEFATLTDIQGMEDHFGDMDFKVAGTTDGITAIQLDIKVASIGYDVIEAALAQAKEARLFLLQRMTETIAAPRAEVSEFAPRMTRIQIPVGKIGVIIGPGGKTIRGIVEETGATVDVQDDGVVMIGSTDKDAARKAIEIIESLTREAKVGDIYTGKVVRILSFGAFVELFPGTDGMVHISQLADHHVATVEDEVELGEEITVQVIGVDPSGKISLSRRVLLQDDESADQQGSQGGTQGPSNRGRPPSGYRPGASGNPSASRPGPRHPGDRRNDQQRSPRPGPPGRPRHSGPRPSR